MKVTYLDHMGTDLTVVNAARVSFGKTSEWEEFVSVPIEFANQTVPIPKDGLVVERDHARNMVTYATLADRDQKLIAFLARGCTSGEWDQLIDEVAVDGDYHGISEILHHVKSMPTHWTPFGHCQVSLHLKLPIFVANQIKRHQVGFCVNEVSRRYVDDEPEFYEPAQLRLRAENAKQGSSDRTVWEGGITINMGMEFEDYSPSEIMSLSVAMYRQMIADGVCPEQARMVLPLSTYTEFWMTGSLYAWANLYVQRIDPHAQKETQEVARQIGEIVEPLFPVSWTELTR